VAPGQVAPGQVAGLYRAPGQVAPGQVAPGQVAPGQVAPLDLYGLLDPANAGALSPFAVNPFQLYPISQRAYTNVGGANLSGTDVSLDELGLGQLATDAGLQVLAYSANRGVQDDVVSVRLDEPQTEVYVLVAGANGEFSRAPYSLQVEGSVSFDQVALAAGRLDLFGGTCQRTALGGNTPAAPISAGGASPTRTLVVTNWERLRDTSTGCRAPSST
jgi:hypothetical protein